jgi:HTH-type transcriptional regulator/antitoxin HigA
MPSTTHKSGLRNAAASRRRQKGNGVRKAKHPAAKSDGTGKVRTLTRNERDDYMSFVRRFPLTSIRSESELLAAQEVIDELLKAPRLKNGAIQYLDALSDLVMAYENIHHAIAAPSDAELLQHLMDSRAINQSALHKATGIAISTISEILTGRRTFSKDVIAKLSRYFGVDKGLFAANF